MPPLIPATMAFAVGVLLALSVPMSAAMVCAVIGLGVAGAALCRPWARRGMTVMLLVWLSLGMLRAVGVRALPAHHMAWLLGSEPSAVTLHGVIVNDPVELFSPYDERHAVSTRLACVVEARDVQQHGRWQHATGRVRVTIDQPRVALGVGDEVLLEGRWSRVPDPGNPGQYDWRASLARQSIHALMTVEPFEATVRLHGPQGPGWRRGIASVRRRLEQLIDTHFSYAQAGLLRAFLLGERVALDERLKRAFIGTGTMHLVVVSGFNVGLIAVLLEVGLRLLGMPFRLRLVATAIGVGGYCLLVGMQPPVVRATLMAWIVLGALWLDRVLNWPNTLAAAALLMLWLDPLQLGDPSFQLSVGAVASLLLFAGRFRAAIEPRLRLPIEWLRRTVAVSLASTLAIWVGLWPLLAWYFHLVSPISVLANLVLVPLVSAMVGAGTLLLGAGLFLPVLVGWGRPLLGGLVQAIVACVEGLHRVPGGSWGVGTPPWWLIGGYGVLVGLSLLRRWLRWPVVWVMGCWLLGLNGWLWASLAIRQTQARWLEMTVLDVGHGDALVLRTPNRQTVVIDAGTPEAGRYVLVPFLRAKGWLTVDALLLTHPDADHVGGAAALLEQVRVRRLFTNGSLHESLLGRQVLERAAQRRIPQERLAAGNQLTGVSGVEMIVLHPPREGVPGAAGRSNDNSVVLKVTHGATSFLLCGDLEEQGVPWVLQWGDALRATVLKVPHHGSALGGATQDFFERVHPEISILSVGWLHHLPSSEVVNALARVGTQLYLTRRDGAITVRTDGERLLVHTFQ